MTCTLLRRTLAVVIISVCTAVGTVGVADVASASPLNGRLPADGGMLRWYCEATGGVYYGGYHVAYCFYRDGKTIACYRGTRCKDFIRPRKATATAG